MSQEPITVVEYDPEWSERYAEEERRIRDAVGDHIFAIEHIGSTAVPGLGAKPIVDIMGGVETLADAELCIEPLKRLGYDYRPELEESMPRRRYFRRTTSDVHTHHLHVVERSSEFWDRHLLFRDYLRDHDAVAQRYEDLKRELAERHAHDIEGYTQAKTPFIRKTVERAREYYDRE